MTWVGPMESQGLLMSAEDGREGEPFQAHQGPWAGWKAVTSSCRGSPRPPGRSKAQPVHLWAPVRPHSEDAASPHGPLAIQAV